jgi:hypothetical protein
MQIGFLLRTVMNIFPSLPGARPGHRLAGTSPSAAREQNDEDDRDQNHRPPRTRHLGILLFRFDFVP